MWVLLRVNFVPLPMKLKIQVLLAVLCGGLAAFGLSQAMRGATESSPTRPAEKSSLAPASAPALTRAEALKIIAESRLYVAHPQAQPENSTRAEPLVTTPAFDMNNPPPAPRTETKPPTPAPGLVWAAGHYMPVKGVWRWVNGEWAAPATPISVWIPANYNAKKKKWSPGYWQPDAPYTAPAGSPPKPATPATPARY